MTGIVQPVVYVLDGSGSMTWDGKSGKSKAEEAREALVYTIQYFKGMIEDPKRSSEEIEMLAERIYTNFVVFSMDAKCIFEDFRNIKEIDENEIKPPTEYLEPDGTNIYRGLEVARDVLAKYISKMENEGIKTHQATIILLTDGCHTHYPPDIPETIDDLKYLAKEIKARGVYICVIQYGNPSKEYDGFPDACPEINKEIASDLDQYMLNRISKKMENYKEILKDDKLFAEAVDIEVLKIFFVGSSILASLK